MKTSRGSVWVWAAAGFGVLGLLLTADIAVRHYRSSQATFERTPPDATLGNPDSVGIQELTAVTFASKDGVRISAWHSPARNGAAIVLAHGTNADRSSLTAELRFLAAQGFGVLAYDGPGYGLSGGAARWGQDAQSAAIAAVDWLSKQPATAPLRIGGLGLSMGGYALIQAASVDRRIEAMVLEAVPPDAVETTQWQHKKWGPISQWPALEALKVSPELLAGPNAERRLPSISPRPVLLVSGDQDQTVPLFMTERMFRVPGANKEIMVVPGAGHGRYIESSAQEYPKKVIEFFTRTLLSDQSTAASGATQ